jgi:hypothetical protein
LLSLFTNEEKEGKYEEKKNRNNEENFRNIYYYNHLYALKQYLLIATTIFYWK